MAKQRYINTHFWDDKFIIDLDPTEKLLFIYCLTNPLTNIVGAYEISIRRIAFDTGIDRDMVLKIFGRFEAAEKMYYRDGWLVIANFIKHQALNPKIVAGIRTELTKLPEELTQFVNFEYEPKEKIIRKKVPLSVRKKILERDNYTCQFCGSKENPEIDHITPVALGGTNAESNLRVLCQSCNGKRNAELRWTSNGDVESKNSLPTEIGGLSHLNSNSNRDSNSNGEGNAAAAEGVQEKQSLALSALSDENADRLIAATQKIINVALPIDTQSRIAEVVPSALLNEWIELIKNRMVGREADAPNTIKRAVGFWLSDFQKNYKFQLAELAPSVPAVPTVPNECDACRRTNGLIQTEKGWQKCKH